MSHDIDEAIKMADTEDPCCYAGGELMQYDTPSKMLVRPKNEFVREFFGKDRAIKSLNLHTIQDLREMIGLGEFDEGIIDTKTINVNHDLRNTLSILLNQGSALGYCK